MKKIILGLFALISSFNAYSDGLIVKVQSEFYSCQQIKDLGFSTGNGNYDINLFGLRKTVYCDMTSDGDNAYTELPFEYSLLDQENITIISDLELNSSFNGGVQKDLVINEVDKQAYRYLIENNLTELVRFKIKAYRNGNSNDVKNGDLLLRLNGSSIIRDYNEDLPENIKTLPNNPEYLVYARVSSWYNDSDNSRFYSSIRDSTGTQFSVADTGHVNWSSTPSYRSYLRNLPDDAQQIRWYARCIRNAGTQCSADVLDFTFVLYPRLPQLGQMVRIIPILPRNLP